MKYAFFICLFAVPLWVPLSAAQEVLLNEEGKRIVVFPDGSWRYFREEGLSLGKADSSAAPTPEEQRLLDNRRRCESALALEKQLALELIQKRLEILAAAQDLTAFREQGVAAPLQTLMQAENRLNAATKNLEQLNRRYDLAKRRSEFLAWIIYFPPAAYDQKLAEWEKENNLPDSEVPILAKEEDRPVLKKYSSYNPAADVILNPPVAPCIFSFEGRDGSGNVRRDLIPELIFSKTDPALLEQFPQGDFITGKGFLTRISGGVQAFTLEVLVGTQRAPELFGVFKYRDVLELQLLDGNVLRLFNQMNDPGRWEPAARAYVYRAQYALGLKDEKLLRSSELDLVRIRWSKVQEDFPVYELDFFKRQFDCLDHEKGF